MFKIILYTILTSIFVLSNDLTNIHQNIVLQYTLYLPNKIDIKPKVPLDTDINITQVKDWKKSLPIPSKKTLKYFGVGFNKNDFLKIESSTQAYSITVKFRQIQTLTHHKDIDNYLYSITKENNGYLYDEETREMFKPSSWKNRRLINGWHDKQIAIDKHIVIHYYQRKPKEYRLITLGMAKFGLPDIAIEDIFSRNANDLSKVINLTAYSLLDNIEHNNTITINLDNLAKKYTYAKNFKDYRYKNHKETVILGFKQDIADEGDPKNRIIELTFKPKIGEQRYATQARYLEELFGLEDKVTDTSRYNYEMLRASKKDLAMLPKIKKIFNNKLKLNEYILVKVPFKYEKGREWMWVLVTLWKDDKIEGILNNKPYFIKNLHSGDKVGINQKDVFDFLYHKSDGTEIGDATTKVILKYKKL